MLCNLRHYLPLTAFMLLSVLSMGLKAESLDNGQSGGRYAPYGPYRDGKTPQKFFDKTYRPYGAAPYGKHPYGPYGTASRKPSKSILPDAVEEHWKKRSGQR